MLNAHIDRIVVVAFIELVSRMKDTVDDLDIFRRIAYLIIDYPGLVHQQVMINKNILCSQIKCVSSEVVQLVDIDSIYLVADQLKLPQSLP